MNDDQSDTCFNTGDMLCRHPHGKCRYMIGRVKPFTVPIINRKCGIAYPDNECKPISREDMEKKNYKEIHDELKLMGEMLEELRD